MKNKKKFTFIHLLSLLAAGIALLLYNKDLKGAYKKIRKYDTDSMNQKKLLRLQEAMLEISESMTKINGLDDLLDMILKKAIEVIPGSQFGSILIINEEGLLEFHAISGFDPELLKIKLDPKECYQWRATSGHFSGPLIIQDLSKLSKDFMSEETYTNMENANALEPKSSISAPLLINGDFFGSINIDSAKTNAFQKEDIKLMAYFADQITIAIRNHLYYDRFIYMSKFDSLTGVMNRHCFQEYAQSLLEESSTENLPITFVLMDLNDFKPVNDQYGHVSGDTVLAFFAKMFSSRLAETDLLARYGGDEFVAVFLNSDSGKTQEKMSLIHREIVAQSIHLKTANQDVHCDFSYGLAEFPIEGKDLKTLFHLADQRMYQQKNQMKQ